MQTREMTRLSGWLCKGSDPNKNDLEGKWVSSVSSTGGSPGRKAAEGGLVS